jgi:hypothetical protein
MEKPSLAKNEGLPMTKKKIALFSDLREVSLYDTFLNFCATTMKERENESPEISKRRREINAYQKVFSHFQEAGYPAIVPSHIYQALEKLAS